MGLVVQRIAIGVVGFLAGALIAISLAGVLSVERGLWYWVAPVVGGLIGALLLATLFDWALIGRDDIIWVGFTAISYPEAGG